MRSADRDNSKIEPHIDSSGVLGHGVDASLLLYTSVDNVAIFDILAK